MNIEEDDVAEATPRLDAPRRVPILVWLLVALPALVLLPTAAPSAGASGSISVSARINGTNVASSTQQQPVHLSPDHPAVVAVRVANRGGSRVTIATVRVEGTVIGLTFFSYDTSVDLVVRSGQTTSVHFALDTGGLGGQATGLIPGSVVLLNAQRDDLASVSMVTKVNGSLVSVYGLFGLALLILTVLAFADVVLAVARQRMPANRWRRALRFLAPGIGFGLVLVFTLSALAVWIPSPGTWLVTVLICAAAFFVVGYLSPTPAGPDEDDEDLDESEFLAPAADTASEGQPVA
jgi:hypothetical protein